MKNFILSFILLSTVLTAQANFSKVQAGLMYHFTKYVEWPADMRKGDFVIGVIGGGDIVAPLQQLAKAKKAGTQKIVIKVFNSMADVKKCNILYLPKDQSSKFNAANALAAKNNSLLITENAGLGKKGSSVNFILQGGKPKFEINKASIKKAGLKVNDKLVALGIVVG
ncbi:MAG: YfiR family protein [Cytophagales bacterium]|nr:YfiR family protein [Cytophagales bacterium]